MSDRAKILLVDDRKTARNAVMNLLKSRPIKFRGHFTEATTGEEALDLITQESFDVIILDLALPGIGGIELLSKVADKLDLAPVIVLTGHSDVKTALEAGKLNVFDYIPKADLGEKLGAAILGALSEKSNPRHSLLAAAKAFFLRAGFDVRPVTKALSASKLSSPEWRVFGQVVVSCFEGRLTRVEVAKAEQAVLKSSPTGGIGFVLHSNEIESGAPHRIWRARQKQVFIIPLYYPKMRNVMESDDADDCYHHLVDLKRAWCIMSDPYESLDATADPQWFVGRQDLIRQILTHIISGSDKHVIVHGMRKSGKTALLNQVELACRAMRFPTARWVAMKGVGFETVLYNFIADLIEDSVRMYPDSAPSVEADLQQYLENPTASFKRDLKKLRLALSKHSGEKVKLILIIDEMDINNFFPWEGDTEEHYQRFCDLFQTVKEVTESIGDKSLMMIIAGEYYWIDEVDRFPYNERFQNPMYERFLHVPLTFLTRKENAELVSLLGELAGLEFTSASLEKIFSVTCGHPQITRWLCSCIWRRRESESYGRKVTIKTVTAALDYFLRDKGGERYRNYFEQVFWCDPLSPEILSDQYVLAEIAIHTKCLTTDLFDGLCNRRGEIEGPLERDEALSAISRLTELGIIEEVKQTGVHRITVPLYQQWIRIEKLGLTN